MKIDKELAVGFFLFLGILSLVYLSIKLGRMEMVGKKVTTLYAEFENVGGIKPGASIEVAGVSVGTVKRVMLDNYQARLELQIEQSVKIQEDAIASIKTSGLIGERFLAITPGGSEKILHEGGTIRETESAVDIEQLISKYVFGRV
jgi:phospholipid/cholesterol/gamma-HCH transport system substrate-binding protein